MMSTSAMQLATFCKEVAQSKTLWAVKDVNGFPAPAGTDGKRAMPFWSSQARALHLISIASQFAGFEPVPISWEVFCDRWLPGLEQDGLLVGVNWAGATASGFDMHPSELKQNVEAAFG
jgi:hypothetical protein